jgi:hypothetical protein
MRQRLENLCEVAFKQGLVFSPEFASGMARKIGQLDNETSEARTAPSWGGRPVLQLFEVCLDDSFGLS